MSVLAGGLSAEKQELAPGQELGPYHYDHGNETWLLVTAGHPTARYPGGEERLGPGDMVCFPAGPAGAHQVSNHGTEPARVIWLTTRHVPSVLVFPDTGMVELRVAGESIQLRPVG